MFDPLEVGPRVRGALPQLWQRMEDGGFERMRSALARVEPQAWPDQRRVRFRRGEGLATIAVLGEMLAEATLAALSEG